MHIFQDDPSIKNRVKLAVGLLVGSKILNVSVPFLFKHAIDNLNAASIAANGAPILGMDTAPETITTVATSLLIGCEQKKKRTNYILTVNFIDFSLYFYRWCCSSWFSWF